MGGLAMLAGRYVPMLAALAVAGAFATRPVMATGRGTLRTDNPTFVSLVLAVVVVVVLLTFVPALLLGSGVQGLDRPAVLIAAFTSFLIPTGDIGMRP